MLTGTASTHVINDVDVAWESTRDLWYRVCIKKPATNKSTATRSMHSHFQYQWWALQLLPLVQ